jgi:hypothetical protein
MDRGLDALARSIRDESLDFEEAEAAFSEAARINHATLYPRFCLTALAEMAGNPPGSIELPEGWSEAVARLTAGDYAGSGEAFDSYTRSGRSWADRAGFYHRLAEDLAQRTAGR